MYLQTLSRLTSDSGGVRFQTMRATMLIVVGLIGCGGMEPGPDADAGEPISSLKEALSGSRLKVRYIEGEDGSKITTGFFDTAREEACAFALAEDGVLRCLPVDDVATIPPGVYLDALCRQPVAVGACALPRYARSWSPTCPPRALIVNVTATSIVPPALYTNVGTACAPIAVDPNQTYWTISRRPAAPEQWVAGTVRTSP